MGFLGQVDLGDFSAVSVDLGFMKSTEVKSINDLSLY